jgi:hypothetical protein
MFTTFNFMSTLMLRKLKEALERIITRVTLAKEYGYTYYNLEHTNFIYASNIAGV